MPGSWWHLCGRIERIPGGTRQNDGQETGIVGAAATRIAWYTPVPAPHVWRALRKQVLEYRNCVSSAVLVISEDFATTRICGAIAESSRGSVFSTTVVHTRLSAQRRARCSSAFLNVQKFRNLQQTVIDDLGQVSLVAQKRGTSFRLSRIVYGNS